MKNSFSGDSCFKELCGHRGCDKAMRRCTKDIGSMEIVAKGLKGEVNEIRATPGRERVRTRIDSGAVDAVGPAEVAKAFNVRETAMSKRGVGHTAANWSSIVNQGEDHGLP